MSKIKIKMTEQNTFIYNDISTILLPNIMEALK
jgi:hypothetical protein